MLCSTLLAAFDCAFLYLVITTEINPDGPSAVAKCDDLANFARHRCSSFLRKQTRVRSELQAQLLLEKRVLVANAGNDGV